MAASREFWLIELSSHAFRAKTPGQRDRVFVGRGPSDRPRRGARAVGQPELSTADFISDVERLPVSFTPGEPGR